MAKGQHYVYFLKYDANGEWVYDWCYSESATSMRVAKEIIYGWRTHDDVVVAVAHNGDVAHYYKGKKVTVELTALSPNN